MGKGKMGRTVSGFAAFAFEIPAFEGEGLIVAGVVEATWFGC